MFRCLQLIKALKCWCLSGGVKVYCWQTLLSRPYKGQLLLLATEQHDRLCIKNECYTLQVAGKYTSSLFESNHAIFHAQHAQTMMLPCWQQQISQAGKAVYVLNKLHWLIQIPQSKQYYHMGLSMSKFGYFTIIASSYIYTVCKANGS